MIDRVLSEMSNETSSLSVSNVNVGCSAHADDIRSCSIGIVNVERGAKTLQSLTSEISLRLNMSKQKSFIFHVILYRRNLSTSWIHVWIPKQKLNA